MKFALASLSVLLFLSSCGGTSFPSSDVTISSVREKDTLHNNTDTSATEDEYAEYFILIADTGKTYIPLQQTMMEIHRRTQWPVDTLNRSYNAAKDLIALAEDDEDEIYAGEYYPRLWPSNTLSLEYLDVYDAQNKVKTIALVAGIFEQQHQADSTLSFLKQYASKAYAIKAKLYTGCMH